MTSPTHWLNVQAVALELPGIGTQQLDLFEADTHERLDALMHLPADHHENQQVTLPGVGTIASTGLNDTAEFDPEQFAAYRNAVQTAKLLLLDGTELNDALGDILAADGSIKGAGSVSTYGEGGAVPANVMVDQLSGRCRGCARSTPTTRGAPTAARGSAGATRRSTAATTRSRCGSPACCDRRSRRSIATGRTATRSSRRSAICRLRTRVTRTLPRRRCRSPAPRSPTAV